MTEIEIKEIVDQAAKAAVKETLLGLGVNIECPRDMLEQQRDFQYLRDMRTTYDGVKKKGLLGIVGLLVTGIMAALWMGFKEAILK